MENTTPTPLDHKAIESIAKLKAEGIEATGEFKEVSERNGIKTYFNVKTGKTATATYEHNLPAGFTNQVKPFARWVHKAANGMEEATVSLRMCSHQQVSVEIDTPYFDSIYDFKPTMSHAFNDLMSWTNGVSHTRLCLMLNTTLSHAVAPEMRKKLETVTVTRSSSGESTITPEKKRYGATQEENTEGLDGSFPIRLVPFEDPSLESRVKIEGYVEILDNKLYLRICSPLGVNDVTAKAQRVLSDALLAELLVYFKTEENLHNSINYFV